MNIVDAILFQCRRQPPVAAICVPGQDRGLISYRRLEQSIHSISRRLLELGLPPGSIVAVDIADMILHAATLLAATRLGLATLSIRGGLPPLPAKIDALITDAKPAGAASDRVAVADPSWTEGDGEALEPRSIPAMREADICRLILTPGPNGAAKPVAVTQRQLSGRIGRHLTVFGNRLPRCDRFYSDLPIATALGFQFLIYSLLRGGTIVFPGDRFDTTLLAIEEYKVQCLLAASDGLETFVQGFAAVPAYQSNLELVVCGGALLPDPLSYDVRSRICSHVVAVYDSAEAGISATAPAHAIAGVAGAAGFVTPGTTVQIVDGSGTVLATGQEGIVRIKSEDAVGGYLGDAAETRQAFRDGWFYPGDTGTLDADAMLVITGRGQQR
jgi:acyl-coenzyme A synthetase/AMP-(fatty) acid ligase